MFKKVVVFFWSFLLFHLLLDAQNFRPKDTWPFLYHEFEEGFVFTSSGEQLLQAPLNISVINQRLYFIKEDIIMEADIRRVFSAKIGNDVYVLVGGKFYRVLQESEGGGALLLSQIDSDRMGKASIGYGVSSATASTQNVSALSLDSNVGTSINQAMASRAGGQDLPVQDKKYILYNHNCIVPALKREIMSIPGLDKKAAGEFFKKNKIKWNNHQSLTQVADFLTDMFQNKQP